jgi:hypothetical protein
VVFGPTRVLLQRIAPACAAAFLLSSPATAAAQGLPAGIDPVPPIAPETITRNGAGQATVRAIRLSEPLRLDGALDESVYSANLPFGGFIQVVPKAGAPSSERTDVWVMFDTRHMYVAARCWDSAPPDKWVANELRRDTNQLRQNDTFGVMFDTFFDRRSGFMFYTNPLGAIADYSVVDEGQSNTDWNPVWDVRTGRFAGGWTVEMAIPFKTLRYRSGPAQVWGIQLRRGIRRKNEWTYLTPVPASLAGPQALNRVSAAGTLVGLDLPPAGRNLELKPYAIARLTTDRVRTPPLSNDFDPDARHASRRNSNRAIGSSSRAAATTSCWSCPSGSARSSSAPADTASATSCSRTHWGSSAASRAPCRSRPAGTTMGR